MHRCVAVAVAVAMSLVACTSTTVPLARSVPVPAERLQYRAQPSPSATFVVIIDNAWARPFVRQQIVVDGVDIALLEKGESVTFKVTPGDHVVGARFPSSLDSKVRTVSLVAEANRTCYFRMGIEASGTATFTRAMSADQ